MGASLTALSVMGLFAIALRARVNRRRYNAWIAISTDREVEIFRGYRTVMYPDADSLVRRTQDWYINGLDAAVKARPWNGVN